MRLFFFEFQYMGVAYWHADETEVQGEVSSTTIPFDYLIYAVGAETQTFGIPGVKEHACFMKEIQDAEKVSSHFEHEYMKDSTVFPSSSVVSWIVRQVIRPFPTEIISSLFQASSRLASLVKERRRSNVCYTW